MQTKLDFKAHYRVDGYRGVAWTLRGYATERRPLIYFDLDEQGNDIECEDWTESEEVEDTSRVIAVMVGDDRKFTFGVDEVHVIPETSFCRSCGQIGCTCNVYE